jgi:hypothetical protein
MPNTLKLIMGHNTIVVSQKYVIKLVWNILAQLSSLNNAWFQGSTFKGSEVR